MDKTGGKEMQMKIFRQRKPNEQQNRSIKFRKMLPTTQDQTKQQRL